MSKQNQIKLIVVGDSGVGKSSILLRFVNDEFNEFSDPTLGAAFLSKIHNYGANQSVRLQMWDTAGQEKYKSIAPIYYRDSQVALCVYDITSRNSFDVLKNWVKELKSQGPKDLILAVVGNKTDRIDNEEVPYEEAKNYAKEIDAVFKLTSAKEGKGINQLFTAIAEKLDSKSKTGSPDKNPRDSSKLDAKKKSDKKKSCC